MNPTKEGKKIMSKVIMAAFDHGQVPTIACINKATVPLGVNFDRLMGSLSV